MSEMNTQEKLAYESVLLQSGVKSWWVLKALKPFENFFISRKIHPNHITYLVTFLTLPCAYLLTQGAFLWCGWITLVVGSLDILDGKLARAQNIDGPLGEFLDSVMDRFQDFFILVGLLIYFHSHWMAFVVLVTIGSTTFIPYIKAKAELLGVDLKRVGLMQRPERFFTLSAGFLVDGAFEIAKMPFDHMQSWPKHLILKFVLVFLALTTLYTAIQRVNQSIKALSKTGK